VLDAAAAGDASVYGRLVDHPRYYVGRAREALGDLLPLSPDETKARIIGAAESHDAPIAEPGAGAEAVVLAASDPLEAVERLTGYRYVPEPEAERAVLVPHLEPSPSLVLAQHRGSRLIVYSVGPEPAAEERLALLGRALADPKRVEILALIAILAAWAEQTSKIVLGLLVTCNSYRNPRLLADMARTVDRVSGGRLVFGIGSGWFERDYEEYGYEFGTKASRGRALAAALLLIKRRWECLNPPPLRRLPILVAGTGEQITLRIVAEHADIWHAAFPERPEQLVPKVEALERWCRELGRDPAEIERAVGVEPDDLRRFLEQDGERYVELGFTQFTLGVNGPAWRLGLTSRSGSRGPTSGTVSRTRSVRAACRPDRGSRRSSRGRGRQRARSGQARP
jgi:Luciferase-like monooxygenase